ncbi:MAG: ABC transporter permease [Gemmatimonadaceae bacterium]|nr:ABC transporter permease [Gemmatimonadaceae bacterium]
MGFRNAWMRVRANFRRASDEQDLQDEIQFHLDQETAKHVRHGIPPDEARRRALAAFGGVERTKETYRDGRGDRPLADVGADLGFALRLLRRNPTLAGTVILTLALGMGSVVAIFSAVSAVILRPLPFTQPDRLVALWENNDVKGWRGETAAPANMLDWRERVSSFSGVEAWTNFTEEAIVVGAGDPTALRAVAVTGGFFRLLGVRPALGAGFDDGDTWSTGRRVVLLSHRAWRDKFGSDSSVVGRTLRVDGRDAEVVGVMPGSFGLPSEDTEMWTPSHWDPQDRGQDWFRRAHFMRPVARLAAGVSIEQARAELMTVMSALEREHPRINASMKADLGPLHEYLVGSTRRPLMILLGATGLLLLIACANVGNLLLVRAAAREREVVLRRALGASWGRIVRQALTESALLSLIGGTVGLAIGWWGTRVLVAWQPAGLLPVSNVQPDARVVAVVLMLCAASAAIFGTAPALWSAQRPAADALKDGMRGSSAGRKAHLWVHGLAVGEVALAVTLTVAAGLFVRSYQRLTLVDPGFVTSGTVALTLSLPTRRDDPPQALTAFYDQLLARLRAIPGVEYAALTSHVPLTATGLTMDFAIRGRGSDGAGREVLHRRMSRDYFKAMGVPLIAGRTFEDADGIGGEPVIIINQTLATRYFAGRDPIGQYIANDFTPDSSSVWRRVIGVVGDERQVAVGTPPQIEIIDPIYQDPRTGFHVVVRGRGDPSALFRPIESAISALDPMLPVLSIRTMEGIVDRSLVRERFMALLLAAFAVVGAILAVIGVYGVVAQAAQRRIPEIGIRLALGAAPAHVRWLILRHGLALTAAGAVVGSLVAFAAGGVLRQLLFGVSPRDAFTFATVIAAIVVTGVCAAWFPARRVLRRGASEVLNR